MRIEAFAATVIAAALILLGVSSLGSSPTPSAGIWGSVVDLGTGEPIPEVQVFLQGSNRGTRTSHDGLFGLRDVPPGDYELRVRHPCFWTVDVQVEVEEGEGDPVRVDAGLSLRPVRDHTTLGGCASFLPNSR